ncbi:MAG: lytic transglycosylase domain-containing protein [Xanthomonadaceae bacterium]|nr:lytic transglycosylase domain-containing protein [Xanthomonadaceae bacterium]
MRHRSTLIIGLLLGATVACALPAQAQKRTVYRCVRDDTVSLSTAPEPGSRCTKKEIEDTAGKPANLWGDLGTVQGTLYERMQDGKLVYGTRKLPGATPVLKFTVQTPPGSPAHPGLGKVGKPQLKPFDREFRAAAKANKVDDAFVRAIAHAESDFNPQATSAKGAMGVMQLMPDTARELGITDGYAHDQSIRGGARYLSSLLRRYQGDYTRAAAAYNAGIGAVAKYGGVPPYKETLEYVQKVEALHILYRQALKLPPLKPKMRAAQ